MRLRHLVRTPLAYWLGVGALAALTALVVSRVVTGAQAEAARFGALRPVVVVTRDVAAGTTIRAGDVEEQQLPAALVPRAALPSVAGARGRVALAALFGGQPLLRSQLAPWGATGVAALLPPGTRGVAVPADRSSVRVHRGDHVDVLASFDHPPADVDPSFAVATDALVVGVEDDEVTVAVRPDQAARVAYAVTHGTLVLAVRPPGG